MSRSGILLLSNNANSWGFLEWLGERVPVVLCCGKVSTEILEKLQPQLVVSYNYRYVISSDVIDFMQGQLINMHVSLLPWNRGSSPNFWSFIDNTPKGVTIHRVASGLDTGDIIFQKEFFFDEEVETFASSYDKLQIEMVNLFKENWKNLYEGAYSFRVQEGKGSYHTMKDMKDFLKDKDFSWDMKISEFKRKYC